MQDWTRAVITSIVAAVMAGLTAAVKHLWSKQKAQNQRQEAVEDGLKALLHDRIYQSCSDCERKGYADVRDRENLECLYAPYHTLGGNGTGTDLYNKAKDLPTNPVGAN